MHHLGRRRLMPALLALTFAVVACGTGDDDAVSPGEPAGPVAGDTPTTTAAPGDDPSGGESGDESGDETGDETAGEPDGGENDDEADRGADARAGGSPRAAGPVGDVPDACPDRVLAAGQGIAGDFEHVEIGPVDGLNVLTCEWRASGDGIASIEVSFAGELVGTDLASLDGAEPVTVAGVDGHVMDMDEGQVTMFQFVAEDLFITGGSIEVPELSQADILKLAAAAIRAVAGAQSP